MHISCFWLPISDVFFYIFLQFWICVTESFLSWTILQCWHLDLCLSDPLSFPSTLHYFQKHTQTKFFVVDLFRWYTYIQFWLILTHHKYIPVGIVISRHLLFFKTLAEVTLCYFMNVVTFICSTTINIVFFFCCYKFRNI